MVLPQRNIRFTNSEDGVEIAFWEIGEGKPLVIIQNFGLSHSEYEWGVPSISSFYMELAEQHRLIRFDPRGIGLSGDPPGGWGANTLSGAQLGMSVREMGFDIEAVVSALGLASFALMGVSVQGPVALDYAATHPEVSELILCDTCASIPDGHIGATLRAGAGLEKIEKDAGGPIFSFWEKVGPYEELSQLMKLGRATDERGRSFGYVTQLEWDAESSLSAISIPTLILSTRTENFDTLPDSRHLAAGIANSQLVALPGGERAFGPYWSDRAATIEAINTFLAPEHVTAENATSDFRTVVFTDVVESTEYVRAVGDKAGRSAIRDLEQKVASIAAAHDGRVVKNLGDGSLVSFGSNSSAIAFALEFQEKCSEGPLRLRVGMAAGEPIQEDGDIHGTVVAYASRIGDLGEPGEVIVSDSVRQLAAGKGFGFEPRGEVTLKGFDEPERVWKVTQAPRP